MTFTWSKDRNLIMRRQNHRGLSILLIKMTLESTFISTVPENKEAHIGMVLVISILTLIRGRAFYFIYYFSLCFQFFQLSLTTSIPVFFFWHSACDLTSIFPWCNKWCIPWMWLVAPQPTNKAPRGNCQNRVYKDPWVGWFCSKCRDFLKFDTWKKKYF